MADGTKIEWTRSDDGTPGATWNPVTGCTRVSEGCDRCYIERTPPFRMAHRRFDKPGIGGTTGVQLHEDRLSLPLRWRKPRRIFVNSLSDLFHDAIPDEYIARVFGVMWLAHSHTFQVLTKRQGRMRSLLSDPGFPRRVLDAAGVGPSWDPDRALDRPHITPSWWPLKNVWVGVSVENQKWADIRIPVLLETPAAVRWLSCEPLLGPVNLAVAQPNFPHDWLGRSRIDWVVAGGESGPGARPMHPDWVRSLRDQCTATGVAFLVKQWGDWGWPDQLPDDEYQALDAAINLGQPHPQPMRLGKHRTGRLLDGVLHDDYPEMTRV